jgi:hypothetical protein
MSRRLQLLLAVLLPFAAGGATCMRNAWPTNAPQAPQVLTQASSLDQVIAAVNANSARVNSFQTNNARISAPGVPTLGGNIAVERPRKLRLRADTPLTGPEVDLGSNDNEFWFWVRRSEPPAVYFCRHDQSGPMRQAMGIDPDWLVDALGLTTFDPAAQHSGPYPKRGGKLEIHSVIAKPGGNVTKVTVVDAQKAWVLEQHVYDAAGKRIASAVATNHRYDPVVGVTLPGEVNLQMPAAQLTLTIDLGNFRLNSLIGDPMQLFARPVYPGYQEVNLAGPAAIPGPGQLPPIELGAVPPAGAGYSPIRPLPAANSQIDSYRRLP